MKVFGTSMIYVRQAKPYANGNRQVRVIVATKSKAAAARALGVSPHFMTDYASETSNPIEVEKATASPGVPLFCDERGDGGWHEFKL